MFLTAIELSGFRNLAPQEITFHQPLTVITGKNGQGKTSLLEAIYLLSHNRSFRSGRLKDVLQWGGAGRASVAASLRSTDGERRMTIDITPQGRRVTVNGKPLASFAEFFGQAQVIAFTPETLQLVKGPPAQRRGFLDRILAMIDPVFVESATFYHRAVKQRNALLHRSADHGASEMAPWDELIVRHGREVARCRRDLVEILKHSVPAHYRAIAGEGGESVSVLYSSEFLDAQGQVLDHDRLLAEVRQRLHRDQRLKSTSFGVHHDDIELHLHLGESQHDARTASSQGQARSIALAMNFAGIDFLEDRLKDSPIVLLDDVESELDRDRRQALLRSVLDRGYQVLLTTTDADYRGPVEPRAADRLVVEHGRIVASRP